MPDAQLVTVACDGLVAAATACWRLRENIRATVVAKAEFSFADGTLTQIQAQPVRPDTELAFVLPQAEVVFAGLRRGRPSEPARIAVWRGAHELLGVDVAAGDASPGGRVPPFAPERAAGLSGMAPAALHQPFVELPDGFDGAFFQSAPPSQRLAGLAGGDTVVLDNLFPGHRRLTLQLPRVEVTGHAQMGDRTAPIRLSWDTVCIDAETHRCTLLWRGRIAASTVDALKHAVAAVEHRVLELGVVRGDMPPPWPSATATPPPSVKVVQTASPFDGTVELGAAEMHQAMSRAPTPFAQPPGPKRAAASEQKPDIPGAPWAQPSANSDAPAPVGNTATQGLGSLQDHGTKPAAAELQRAREQAEADRREEERREEERREEERREEERRAEAMAEAEERRRTEAERFAAEQRAAEKAAEERTAREAAALEQSRQKIKTGMYGSWKFKDKK